MVSDRAIEIAGIIAVVFAMVLFGAGAIAGALTPRGDLHRVLRGEDEIEP